MMLFWLLLSFLVMPSSSSSSSPSFKPKRPSSYSNPNPNSLLLCKHSPSATIDLLIFVLVLFSSLFLIASSVSYLFHSLCLLLPPSLSISPLPLSISFLTFFAASFFILHRGGFRSRKCGNPKCKGLKKAMEFDIQLQTEECLRSSAATEIDVLPWKGGAEGNPDYECLRSELRRMAPPNGRAVLLFRSRCGCPVAKLEAWGPKRGRRHKKAMGSLAIDGGDHR
ncbi:uncharacterized protein At5g19025-like [Aristolochia californica]|uniref:uncharacterized protein At5g19025-like n=1 Tax=Aristolochia californica TaxID=171875 RepID=UPI0035DE6144